MGKRNIERNEKGEPFSKWLPADKFRHLMPDSLKDFAVEEYEFHEDRKWRWDFCWPTQLVAVEIDGFGFGHQAQQCMAEDNEKANAGVERGWRVFRFNSRQLGSRQGVADAVEQVWFFMCTLDNEKWVNS